MIAIAILLVMGLALSMWPWKKVALGLIVLAVAWAFSRYFLPPNVWEPLVLISMPPLLTGWLLGLLARATFRKVRAA